MKSTKDYLVDLIQIDTQNHKANESELVDYLIEFCLKHQVTYKTYSKKESRKNIIMSVGQATDKDLLVLGHTDVVTAKEEDGWKCPPFSGEVIDGYLYGRGTVDMKYVIASSLSIIVGLKKIEHELKRGIHFIFTADEENGSDYGMKHLMTYPDVRKLLSNKIALNEGGGFSLEYENQLYYLYETGQKSVGRIKVSVEELENSSPYFPSLQHEDLMVKAIRAIEGIDLKSSLPNTTLKLLRTLVNDPSLLEHELLEALGRHMDEKSLFLLKSMSESYITATMIKGGSRNKELPSKIKAQVIFDMRLLPNIQKEDILKKIEASVKDLNVKVELLSYSQGFEAETNQPIVELFEKSLKAKNGKIKGLLPFITPGSNDGKFLKEINSPVFGFAPLCQEDSFVEVIQGIHSVNERIKVESIEFNKEVLEAVIINYLKEGKYVD